MTSSIICGVALILVSKGARSSRVSSALKRMRSFAEDPVTRIPGYGSSRTCKAHPIADSRGLTLVIDCICSSGVDSEMKRVSLELLDAGTQSPVRRPWSGLGTGAMGSDEDLFREDDSSCGGKR